MAAQQMTQATTQASGGSQQDPVQLNSLARQYILQRALNMWQPIAVITPTGTLPGQIINVPVRNVGFIKRFKVEIAFSVAQTSAETQFLTRFGVANFLSQIIFTDLANQTRLNSTGWAFHNLATARRAMAYGAAFSSDTPTGIGSNFPVITAPVSVTTVKTGRMFYELPVTYSDYDLRGGIYANVVSATMNLQLTINPNFFAASGADATLAVYQSSTATLGTLSAVTITILQNYLDQIPEVVDQRTGQSTALLPMLDISTAYLIQNTQVTALAQASDNPIPYANFRQFMSTFVIYDNAGVLNVGSDINTWKLASANFTFILNYDPFMSSLLTREYINDDFQYGTYYFDHRQRPLVTTQFGNLQLIVNPSSVTSATTSLLYVNYEMLALINVVTQSGSLYGN